MNTIVNTVTGPVPADQLGKTLMHEHFVFGYPGFDGDVTLGPFDREAALQKGSEMANALMKHGLKTVIDVTPNECGRNPELLRDISEKTGLQIICATGYYFEGEGAPAYFRKRLLLGNGEEEIYQMFLKEITEGIGTSGIKPGVIKLASSERTITDYEKAFFRAAARAQKDTGITLITHTQVGTMGPEQAELLVSEGANPKRVIIGHMCGNTDIAYHVRTLSYGVGIAFDRFGLQGMVGAPMDELRVACLAGLIAMGYGNRITLSHDKVNVWLGRPRELSEAARKLLLNWHPTHLFENIVPALRKAGVADDKIRALFEENIANAFSG